MSYWAQVMEAFGVQYDQLLKWITGQTTIDYWVYDHCGERRKLKPSWGNTTMIQPNCGGLT